MKLKELTKDVNHLIVCFSGEACVVLSLKGVEKGEGLFPVIGEG